MPAPEKFTKTRLAPTPSGFLHLGNVLSFVLTSVLADKHSAGIFLRIDDLDKDRTDPLYILDIFDTLNFLKIPWSEGPVNIETLEHKYTQTKRLALYNKALEQLCQTGKVYACSCSRSQVLAHSALGIYPCTCRNKNIPLHTENTCWRLNTENAGTLSVNTLENGSIEAPLPPEICDLVVRKKDKMPAYQITSVVDDLFFGIDLVVRGEDLWPSTLVQHYLSGLIDAHQFREVHFHHHPLLLNAQGHKLSKSSGSTSVNYLRRNGYSAADIFTLLAKQLGIKTPVTCWEDFKDQVLDF